MYKLLIADDETVEREAIQFFIKSGNFPFDSIEEAANGVQAVIKARELQPDIAILDIKMPGKDGLEVAREIRQMNAECKIIFLTAFDEIGYTHQAIKLKAEDFIIKPAYGETLIEILHKVISDLDKRQAQIAEKQVLDQKAELFTKWVENDLMLSAAKGYIEEHRLSDYFKRMGLEYLSAVCALVNIRSDLPGSSASSAIYQEAINRKIKGIINTECRNNDYQCLFGCSAHMIFFMVMANVELATNNLCDSFFAKISKAISGQIDLDYQIGIGKIFSRTEDTSNSFFQAKIACKNRNNSGVIFKFEKNNDSREGMQQLLDMEKKLCENIVKGNEREAEICIEEIMDWISQYTGLLEWIREKVHELIIILDRAIIAEFNVETILDQERLIELNNLNSMNEIIIFVKNIVAEIIIKISSLDNSPSALLIDKACIYIDQNYAKDITLEKMARIVGFNKFYFSKLFKEQKKMNFIDYITTQRMQRAKGLLSNFNFSIKEISAEIGYGDPNYFTYVFKKSLGLSPTEYRSKVILDGSLPGANDNSSEGRKTR